ncbi:MAG: hypothetical protein KKA73_07090 [Chloroflexi bacterium]|nr:hypothetical protein [Chloroflexota bacterium]MBU1747435.1 hypothetical protein [Chloroflexota bacterium]
MQQSLVAFDTDQIKGYVFATGKLKEIRGASALLDRLNRAEMPRLVGGTTVYANGGSGLFVVDTAQTEATIQAVQHVYRTATHTATITGAMTELPDDSGGDVQHQLSLVRHRLRMAKDGQGKTVRPTIRHPLLRFCDSCGEQYAETIEAGEMLCQGCSTKRAEDRAVKVEIQQWASGQSPPDQGRLWGRLLGELRTQSYPIADYGRPESFEALGSLSSPHGYMGLIYADGDGMGREIQNINTLADMRRFAEAVDGSVYQAISEAIVGHLQPAADDTCWPFDVLLLGGDDLVMVTRARSAIDVALHLVERFPVLTAERWGRPLSLSASVILTHVNYPFGSLLDLAESGLKFAKRQAANRRSRGEVLDGGLINFLVISSANHLDFGQYYEQTLKQEEQQATFYRTQRPYTSQEMRDLLALIRQVKDVPRTKLEQLRAAIFKSQRQGTIDAMMVALRSRDAVRQKLFGLVGDTPARQLRLPWVEKDGDWVTPVLDVVELLDFVQ